jgi:heme/copper-type cytochrome/quinol oxidase subunit 4
MVRFRSTLISLALSGILTLLSVAAAMASNSQPPFPR